MPANKVAVLFTGVFLGVMMTIVTMLVLPVYYVHDTGIGGFVFKNNKIYELTELLGEIPATMRGTK